MPVTQGPSLASSSLFSAPLCPEELAAKGMGQATFPQAPIASVHLSV